MHTSGFPDPASSYLSLEPSFVVTKPGPPAPRALDGSMRCESASAAAERVVVLRKLRRSCGLMRGLLSRGMRSGPGDSARPVASPATQRANHGPLGRLG